MRLAFGAARSLAEVLEGVAQPPGDRVGMTTEEERTACASHPRVRQARCLGGRVSSTDLGPTKGCCGVHWFCSDTESCETCQWLMRRDASGLPLWGGCCVCGGRWCSLGCAFSERFWYGRHLRIHHVRIYLTKTYVRRS